MTPSQMFKDNIAKLVQQVVEESPVWHACVNCRHFHEASEQCFRAVPTVRPPARVITFGCEHFNEVDSNRMLRPTKERQ